jgi:type VI secretion system secreted protein Hcp
MAVDMFLKLGTIKGEAKDTSHKDDIDILAWSWGASNSGTAHTGGGAGAGKVNVQDLSVTKWVDLASSSILQAVSKGTHIPDATLVVRKAGDKPLEYITITMSEVLITSVSTGGSGGEDRLTENVTLNFAKFKYEYKEQTATGGAGQLGKFGWDITKNEVVAF